MLNKFNLLCALVLSSTAQAELINLDNEALLNITGQGGADLSWTLSLNHQYANNMSLKNISEYDPQGTVTQAFYSYQCGSDILCRFAFSPNNHTENGSQKWLVFKQLQGTLQIDKFSLDGSTILNREGEPQTALQLTFYDDHPLKVRNLGFKSLAVESGSEGYLNDKKYTTYDGGKLVPRFDQGGDQGFMGVNMHGNLHMSGNLKIFSYNCAGTTTSRC